MNKFVRIFAVAVTTVLSVVAVRAEEVRFTASAPSTVAVGESFQLVYNINATGKNLRIADFKGFEIIAGPFKSTSSSVQIVNGNMVSSKSVSTTYTLLAESEGTFTLPAATIVVDGKTYHSNAVQIKVLPEDQASPQGQGNRQQSQGSVPTSSSITAENLFVRAIVSKTKVYEQEAFIVSYKIYSRVDLEDIAEPEFPDFKGCLMQEIDIQTTMERESYNGKNYNTWELRRVLLFPQKAGELTIDRMRCKAIVRVPVQSRSRSFFDPFMQSYQRVEKPLATQVVTIDVKPLPTPKPSDFSGAVGNFSISSSISATEVKQHDAITITLSIKGEGNMKMLKTPELKFPKDFETYEPKVTNSFKAGNSGLSGEKRIEYLVIPRHKGEFTIPSVSISYFDLQSGAYRTLQSDEFVINVAKGEGGASENQVVATFTNQEDVATLGSDIRYLMQDKGELKGKGEYFAGSMLFWLSYLIPFVVAGMLLFFFRKQARDNANVALMRNRKANKVALRRLKVADKQCKAGNKREFYEETLKAMWGYLSDKLAIPTSSLSKDNVAGELSRRGVADELIRKFIALLDECEFEQYAPLQDTQKAMDNIYRSAVDVISNLDYAIKK